LIDSPGFARFTSPSSGWARGQCARPNPVLVGKGVHGRVLDAEDRAVAGAELRWERWPKGGWPCSA
jgi:hypothetical protein